MVLSKSIPNQKFHETDWPILVIKERKTNKFEDTNIRFIYFFFEFLSRIVFGWVCLVNTQKQKKNTLLYIKKKLTREAIVEINETRRSICATVNKNYYRYSFFVVVCCSCWLCGFFRFIHLLIKFEIEGKKRALFICCYWSADWYRLRFHVSWEWNEHNELRQ